MDLGLYNKKSEPRGEHGTLIGNWVEERALQQTTGFGRYEELALEKRALNQTQDRIVMHRDNADSGPALAEKVSINTSTYIDHGTSHFTPKIFNQTGSNWHHDGTVARAAGAPHMRSQLSLGTEATYYSTTSGSSFLHSTSLVEPERTPLKLQQTTKFVPRPFPNHTLTGGLATTKLDRPYIVEDRL